MGSNHRVVRPNLKQSTIKRFLIGVGLLFSLNVIAGPAHVLKATISKAKDGSFSISATLRHDDSGWDHYTNRWEVLDAKGEVIAKRVLFHPHVNEQPFTRSQSGIKIPSSLTWVKIRAHDLVHGYGGREVTLSVPHH